MEISIQRVTSIKITDVIKYSKDTGAFDDFKTRMIFITDENGNQHSITLYTFKGDLEITA
jgi:hypothetical protein